MKTLLKILFKTTKRTIFVTIISLYTLVGFIVLPYLIQSNFTKIVKKQLNTYGYIGRVYINPYTFEIDLKNLLIQDDKNENLLYFKNLNLNYELSHLLKGEITLSHLTIDALKTSVTIYKNKEFNFNHILKQLEENKKNNPQKEATEEKKSSLVFNLNKLLLTNTRITFLDQTKSTPFLLESKPFDLELTNFSTKKDNQANLTTNIAFKDTLDFKLDSKLSINPIVANGDLAFTNIQLEKIHSYLQDSLKFKFNGLVQNINSSFHLNKTDENLTMKLSNLDINMPQFKYQNEKFDVGFNQFSNKIETIDIKKDSSLYFQVQNILIETKKLDFLDLTKKMKKPITFKNVQLKSDKYTSDKTKPTQATLSLNTPVSGDINLLLTSIQKPFKFESKTTMKNVSIVPYQIYIKDSINLDIRNMIVNSTTNFTLTKKNKKLTGDVKISKINLAHSLTKRRLLKAKLLELKGINYLNDNVVIDNILLDNFSTEFKIAKNKKTNIDKLVIKKDTKKKTTKKSSKVVKKSSKKSQNKKKKPKFNYYVKKLELKNGKAGFSDHSLPLNFDTNIHSLKAKVEDLSSKNKESKIVLHGVIEKYGLANIEAKTITSNFKTKTDVAVKFENLDIRSFSPYSGKFIGQKISDGRLWLNLNYQINKSQLSSTNNIKLKNFTLGDEVESPDAKNLPVGLAIALLEDSDHIIDLDVPITGDMSNPKFELGGVIWKALGNIITNVVSAPFRFLGSMLGLDSDELGTVEFNYGSAAILPPQKEKLDKLLTVLNKKDSLAISLVPSYDKQNDSKILLENQFNILIKSDDIEEKIRDIFEEKFGKDALKKVENEVEILVEKAKENKEKIDEDTKVTEILSQKIKETIVISDKQLEILALQRVENLKNYFLTHKLRLDKIQIKNSIREEDSSDAELFPFKLELNVKEK